jgi:hypothetical protein
MAPDNTEQSDDDQIHIFLKYDFLTAQQASQIFGIVDNLYRAVAKALVFDWIEYASVSNVVVHQPPLSVKKVDTTNSIEIFLSLTQESMPSLSLEEGKLMLGLPQWALVISVTGTILKYGFDAALDYFAKIQSIEKTSLEIEKTRIEVEKLKKENSNTSDIKAKSQDFKTLILSRNINYAFVNGVVVKNKLDSHPPKL